MLNQAKLRSFYTTTRFKKGYEVLGTCEQAVLLDEKNNST